MHVAAAQLASETSRADAATAQAAELTQLQTKLESQLTASQADCTSQRTQLESQGQALAASEAGRTAAEQRVETLTAELAAAVTNAAAAADAAAAEAAHLRTRVEEQREEHEISISDALKQVSGSHLSAKNVIALAHRAIPSASMGHQYWRLT
jgi:chromosome segregation ATPase